MSTDAQDVTCRLIGHKLKTIQMKEARRMGIEYKFDYPMKCETCGVIQEMREWRTQRKNRSIRIYGR